MGSGSSDEALIKLSDFSRDSIRISWDCMVLFEGFPAIGLKQEFSGIKNKVPAIGFMQGAGLIMVKSVTTSEPM